MFINDLFENKNVKEGWDEVKSRVGDVAKKTANTLVSAGAAAGDAVGAALNVIPRPFDEKTYQDRVSKPYPKTDKKLDEEDSPEIGSTVNVTTVKGKTYTGELVRVDDNSVALRVYAAGGIPHAQNDTEPRSQVIVMKKDHVVSIDDALEEDIPPPENARKTQIASTLGTYKKAGAMLDKAGIQGKSLDFGAGLGKGTAELGKDAESYEPYPREDFKPNYIDATQIPSNSYSRIVNLNVLNVVPNVEGHRIRDEIVRQIGRVLAPGGMALITTRGRDVLTIKGTPGEEPMSMISSIGTYQKGFTSKELKEYVQSVLGDNFEVSSAKLGPAGVMIKKHKESVDETAARDKLHQRHQEIRKQAGRPHPDYYKELRATFDLPDDERWAKVAELKKKYKVAESLRDGEYHTWTVHFDDGTSQQVNVPSDEFDVRGYFAKKGKKVTKVDKSYAVQGQQQDKVKPDNYDDRPDRAAKAQAAHDRRMTEQGVAEATGDPKFDKMLKGITGKKQVAKQQKADTKQQARDAFGGMFGGGNPADSLGIRKKSVDEGDDKFSSMMGKMTSPESLNAREALEMMTELIHQAGASYKQALQQASVSFDITPAKLHALYKQHSSSIAEDNELNVGIEAYGVRGENNKKWRKTFKSQAAFEQWLDAHSDDVEVLGTREVNLNNMFEQGVAEAEYADDDEYYDQDDQESELYSGCYVRDEQDPSGEIFQMRGDPTERRVQILDRNGSGWNISPERLTLVGEGDPDIARYFGRRDLDEEQLDELSPKTLMSYSGKAQSDAKDRLTQVKAGAPNKQELVNKAEKRVGGIRQAHSKVKAASGVAEDINEDIERYVEALSRAGYEVNEEWSKKYKDSINCSNPKGFSQKAHCAGKQKNEEVSEEKVRLDPKCWSGKKIGNPKTKMKGGVRVNNCVPK